MKVVIQRVKRSSVKVEGKVVGEISKGLLILFAVHVDDNDSGLEKLVEKVVNLRIFDDEKGVMNRSLKDIGGEVLVVSQFTLYGDCKKGNRPSYIKSAKGPQALPIYEKFVELIRDRGFRAETGAFGEIMEVEIINDGPTTIIIDN